MKANAATAVVLLALLMAGPAVSVSAEDAAPAATEATEASDGASRPSLLILNFASSFDSGDMGGRVGYSLRAKLRRSERFVMPDELDIEDIEAAREARPALGDVSTARELADVLTARVVVWGEVEKTEGYKVSLKGLDISGDGEVFALEKSASSARQLALCCRELADELALRLTGVGYLETYPTFSTEGYVRVGVNLAKNGDFEKGASTPDNWQSVDGLCSFWEEGEDGGRFIRIDTDVYLSEWQEWKKRIADGAQASWAPSKTPTAGDKYDTVAGTYGVQFYSHPITVSPGATYSIEFDARGLMANDFFFAKVFVKGYGGEGESMEYYKMYKAVRVARQGEWEHFSRIFHPTRHTPEVKFMKVMLYAYWPPGEYAFDNVEIYEVRQEEAKEAEAAKEMSP